LTDSGTFVTEVDGDGNRRVYSYQFNYGTLSVDYRAAYFGDEHAAEMRQVFIALRDANLKEEGSAWRPGRSNSEHSSAGVSHRAHR
jgi:hypothetical protein